MIPCFSCERLCSLKQFKCFSNQLVRQLSIYFQIQVELSSTSYMCTSCFHNISENKPPLYQVLNKKVINKKIPLAQKLAQLEKCLISSCFVFTQIYKFQKYMQHKMYGSVINVPTNVKSNSINVTTFTT
jgi:hypothetical protein